MYCILQQVSDARVPPGLPGDVPEDDEVAAGGAELEQLICSNTSQPVSVLIVLIVG